MIISITREAVSACLTSHQASTTTIQDRELPRLISYLYLKVGNLR